MPGSPTHLLSLEPCQAVNTGISLKQRRDGNIPKVTFGMRGEFMEKVPGALFNPCTHNAAFGAGFPWRTLEKREKWDEPSSEQSPREATSLSPELSPCLL